MTIASGLAMVIIGAILAFAVNADLKILNLHVVGWILIVGGLAGIAFALSRISTRRRVALRHDEPGGEEVGATTVVDERRFYGEPPLN